MRLLAVASALLLSNSASAFAPLSTVTTFVSRNSAQQNGGVYSVIFTTSTTSTTTTSTTTTFSGTALRMMVKGDTTNSIMPLPKGSLVALVTPMTSEGALDQDALRSILQWHKKEGTNGIVILGTTGEASTLTKEEKDLVMTITREEVGGVLPIIVGTGTIDTQQTIAATRVAKANGADAALVVTPYYVKPTQAGLLQHFTTIANAAELPLILYNVPGRTGVDLSVETTIQLAKHPMIKGLKDATGDNNRVGPMRKILGNDFRMYSGEDGMAREYVLQGGDGVISVTANVAPKTVSKVMAAANANDPKSAQSLDEPLASLHRDLFCEANPIPVKWALYEMKKIQNGIRLPLTMLNEKYHDRMQVALTQALCIPPTEAHKAGNLLSYGWPSRKILLQGQLFDSGLINQALDMIEQRNGDFDITSFSVQPNDQFSNADFNFKRPSSIAITMFAVDVAALDDLVERLQTLVDVMESAEGILTIIPDDE